MHTTCTKGSASALPTKQLTLDTVTEVPFGWDMLQRQAGTSVRELRCTACRPASDCLHSQTEHTVRVCSPDKMP